VSTAMATTRFGTTAPRPFVELRTSLFTLFKIFTADGWANIADDVMKHQSHAWIFFVVFVLVSTLVALNLFIAVAVEALDKAGAEDPHDSEPQGPDNASGCQVQEQVLVELRALRTEVEMLRRERTSVEG